MIVGVHTYDYIEIVEILLAYLPATMRQLKTTATGMHPHSVVGELPYVWRFKIMENLADTRILMLKYVYLVCFLEIKL